MNSMRFHPIVVRARESISIDCVTVEPLITHTVPGSSESRGVVYYRWHSVSKKFRNVARDQQLSHGTLSALCG